MEFWGSFPYNMLAMRKPIRVRVLFFLGAPRSILKSHFYRIARARKAIFNLDYGNSVRYAFLLYGLGPLVEIFFYCVETSRGFWDSALLQLVVILCTTSLFFVDWKEAKRGINIIHWEAVLMMVFPVKSAIIFLQNRGDPAHAQSMMLMFMALGIFTKVWMIPVHALAGVGMTATGFFILNGWDGELFAGTLYALIVACFSGTLSAGVMLMLERYHRGMTEVKVAMAKAEDERLKNIELGKANEELRKREELIRIFVRPSLVDEIHAGKDPSKFLPVLRNLTIMFCDIRDFTRLTEILSPYEKQNFLNHYFSIMTLPIIKNGGEVDKIIGDSLMGVFPDGANAVQAALAMRLELQKFNAGMYAAGSPKIRNGIGIAKGEVMQGNFGSFEKMDRTVIGEAVNIASRIESKTKLYNLEIVVTEDVIKDLPPGSRHYRWIDIVQLKGSTRRLKLYEIYGHQPAEVLHYKDGTRDLLEKALTIYFRKGFKDAMRLFQAMLEKVPPHRLIPADLMDNILRYYIAHCEAWISDGSGAWEQIEKWNGVHVFNDK